MKVNRRTTVRPPNYGRRRIVEIESQDRNEDEIVDGLFDTLRDADDCVLIADRQGEIVVYGGGFSGDRRGALRDFIGQLLGEPK